MGGDPAGGDAPRLDRAAIDGQVLWSLVRAAHRAERRLTADLAELELTPIQFGVLSQLGVEGSATSAQLARLCVVRPQTMAGVLDGMVRRGLVRKEGPGGRGRPVRIALTPHGEAVLARAWPILQSTNEAITDGLDAAAVRRLNEVLHDIGTGGPEAGT